MIHASVRKQGKHEAVTLPKEEMERLDLRTSDQIAFQLIRMETRAVLRPELQKALDESWEQ